ncbi:MAG: helix-turn-helix transcriptional regulator [Alphaproteobacteria bacterium]|nr:helix-turn-helix transcriptional regulator [Alphaproteobacteria bacterium]
MESFLQRRIKNYLDATGLSVSALERNAGLKINVARNILRGQSKRPTAETLQAIANVMECTVQDLLGVKKESFTSKQPDDGSSLLEDPEIFFESVQSTLKVISGNQYKLTVKQTTMIIEEVYAYSMKKSPPHVEMDFVEWFIKRVVE